MNNSQNIQNEINLKPKKKSKILLILIVLLVVIIGVVTIIIKKDSKKVKTIPKKVEVPYSLKGNGLQTFDLYFSQLENNEKNSVYSPISIKYALRMLEEGASGNTKKQISDIIGTYSSKKYQDSKNMSFANGLFIKDTYKNNIKKTYIDTLKNKYNADVIYDSFKTPDVLNNWVSKKTFDLVKNMTDDISEEDYILANALAIDMEWVNKIQSEYDIYSIQYKHRNFSEYISPLRASDYSPLEFDNNKLKAKAVQIGAVANKYDIVKTLGEEKIRNTVKKEYQKWLKGNREESCYENIEDELDVDTYVNNYMKEINEGYNDISSSTDFMFYTDDKVKVFAKDLRKYNDTTLQYIGIMPTSQSLKEYIKNIKAEEINQLISNLKPIESNSFKDGVLTHITGYIPMFNFEYQLSLKNDLNKLKITDVFDSQKADLSNLTNKKAYIDSVEHKTNIEFSNDGIKAAAAITVGGLGAGDCGFDYIYDVPIEKIDLSFNKPFLFLIRDKETGEVWFVGSVYEPIKYVEYEE